MLHFNFSDLELMNDESILKLWDYVGPRRPVVFEARCSFNMPLSAVVLAMM